MCGSHKIRVKEPTFYFLVVVGQQDEYFNEESHTKILLRVNYCKTGLF